jgi:hypothetical protein
MRRTTSNDLGTTGQRILYGIQQRAVVHAARTQDPVTLDNPAQPTTTRVGSTPQAAIGHDAS